ncbi:hypothetical protein G7046_g1796 [Stylonectria norvegica]|nr:hypothetical protein G7046_g1796 [Stylonectria norvegica]
MIDEDSKFFSLSGDVPIGGPTTWHITDWDQRRVVSVTMDGEQDDDSLAIEHFSRHSSELPPDVYRIYVSPTGDIVSTYTDPENDQTCCVHYPALSDALLPEGIETVRRNELEELERLGPDADLVAYPPCVGEAAKKVVFKYHFLWQYAQMSWKEMNLWMRLPRHSNVVPFDRVVIDELEGRVVGFTNNYIPGGNLEENKSRVFQLKWLQQLIKVVDDLNLEYGIAHQDIAPRNLLVDEATDSIMLFDFNFAARIKCSSPGEGEKFLEDRNDIKGVIFTTYEIVTQDTSLRNKPHADQNLENLGLEWVKHPEVKLDHPLASYQLLLQEWQKRRAERAHIVQPGGVPRAIHWPFRPKPPQKTMSLKNSLGEPVYLTVDSCQNRFFNHVALSVTDVDAAVKWYSDLFDFKVLGETRHIKRSETPDHVIFQVYGASLHEVRVAFLSTGNGIGLEIFEFIEPRAEATDSFAYHKGGFFHICVTDPDPDAMSARVVKAGGKQIGTTVDANGKGVMCVYVSDPWGNVVEILSVSFLEFKG